MKYSMVQPNKNMADFDLWNLVIAVYNLPRKFLVILNFTSTFILSLYFIILFLLILSRFESVHFFLRDLSYSRFLFRQFFSKILCLALLFKTHILSQSLHLAVIVRLNVKCPFLQGLFVKYLSSPDSLASFLVVLRPCLSGC